MKNMHALLVTLCAFVYMQSTLCQDENYVLTITYPEKSSYLPETIQNKLLLNRQQLLEVTAAFDELQKEESSVGPSKADTEKINISISEKNDDDDKIYSANFDPETQSMLFYILINKIANKYDPLYKKD